MLRILKRIKEWKLCRSADSALTKPTAFEVLEPRILLSGDGLLNIGAPDPPPDGTDQTAQYVGTNEQVVAATVPYTQDFSSGKPGPADGWEYYSDNEGRIEVVSGRLRMDDTTDGSMHSLNEAILHVNLTGKTNATLTLDHWSFLDENHALPPSFTGHENADGIALSVDGTNWVTVADLTGNFTNQSFNLDTALEQAQIAAGSTDLSDVRIKFQQYDDNAAYLDGREFDNIQVTAIESEMDVLGNGQEIADGDTTPSALDHTDFGNVGIGSSLTRTFTIRNTGQAALNLTGSSKVLIVGSLDFMVVEQPSSPVAANGGTTTFQVRFTPSGEGTEIATLVIDNNDADENPYTFEIQGTGHIVQEPEIKVSGNGQEIADGDVTPSPQDGTDFGSVPQGQPGPTQTYTVENEGSATLALGTVNLPAGYSLVEGLDSTLAPGASDTFTVQLDSSVLGTKDGQISFTNTDSDENPFNFAVTGEVTEPLPLPQSIPYTQDFGEGLPGALEGWEYYSDNDGRIEIVGGRLRMDDAVDDIVYSLNEAILHVDLTDKTDVTLTLDHWSLNDEQHLLPPSFIGHQNGDGISLSVDGINWVKFTDLTINLTNRSFNLDTALQQAQVAAGSTDLSDVRIKFQQYDSHLPPLDGREFDNIWVTAVEGGLVGHWKMDDNAANTAVVDSSGTGNDGAAQRNTEDMYAPGVIDGALTFNGTSDYVDLQDVSFPSGNSPRSVSFWINDVASTNNHYIFYYGKTSVNNRFSICRDNKRGGTLAVIAYGNDWDTGYVLPTGVWKHVAFTFDGTDIKLYIDGSFVAGTTKTYNTVLEKAYIGCHGDRVAFFEGMLDQFALFNKALSASEVLALYNDRPPDMTPPEPDPMTWATAPYAVGASSISMTAATALDTSGVEYYFECTAGAGNDSGWQDSPTYQDTGLSPDTQYTYRVKARDKSTNQNEAGWSDTASATTGSQDLPSGLVGYWKMDDNAANTIVSDGSGNGNDGTAQRNTENMDTTGVVDGALTFNGTSDYIDLQAMSLPSGNSPRSVSFWINDVASTNNHYIFYYGKTSVNNRFSICRDNKRGGTLAVIAYGNDWDTGYVLPTGVWTHVAFTFDGSTIKLYIGGSLVASTAKTYNTVLEKAYIGCHGDRVAFFEGMLDEFAVFNKALSASEVLALYNNRPPDVTPPEPDPMSWATAPYAVGSGSISMTAATALDPSGVEYYFECTAGAGNDSGWQDSPTYQDTGLSPNTQYTYRVKARDKSTNQNETGWSDTASATTGSQDLPSGLVGHWKMDDNAADTIILDSSGNGNNGTAQRNTEDMDATGVIDGALTFNGTGDYIDLQAISLPSGNNPRSVSFWINDVASTNNHYILFYGKTSVNNRFSICRDNKRGGKLAVIAYGNDWDTGYVLPTGVWKHVAFTFDGTAIKLYIDGSFVAGTTKTYNTVLDKAYIGCHGDRVAFFEGMLDQFAIYDKALSASEVLALYNNRSSDLIPPVPQSIPYTQDFGSGQPAVLDGWEYYSNNDGRIEIVGGRLRMDDAVSGSTYSLNEAILHLNLTSTNVTLTLDHWNLMDEPNALPPSFVGHYKGDGIAVSVDGLNWVRVANLVGTFTSKSLNLDAALQQAQVNAGSTDLSDVRIKFQQYDDYPEPDDGREIDNIQVS